MEGIRDLRDYFRALKQELVCPFPQRRHFLAETQRMVADFQQGNLDAAEEDVLEFLGSPRELAATFLETIGPVQLQQYQTRKAWLRRGCVLFLSAAFCAVSTWCIYLEHRPKEVEVVETMTIIIHEEVES